MSIEFIGNGPRSDLGLQPGMCSVIGKGKMIVLVVQEITARWRLVIQK